MVEQQLQTIVLAAGCFWCSEAIYQRVKGIINVQSGYSGGSNPNATTKQMSQGEFGFSECAQIQYDPNQISIQQIIQLFFELHDPFEFKINKYSSKIFYLTNQQKIEAAKQLEQKRQQNPDKQIHTKIEQFHIFLKCDEKHNNYYKLNIDSDYACENITPKLKKVKEIFLDFINADNNLKYNKQ